MNYKPMMDDFELELLERVETGIEKAIAEYEVPFANGGILDDMGVKARRFQIRTIWRKQNYELHGAFIEHTAINQLNTFIHPESGIIRGRIKSVNVIHDARLRCAEINIEFLEDTSSDARPVYNPPLEAFLEEGLAESVEAVIDTTAAELGAAGLDTSVEVDPDLPLAGQIPARTIQARAMLARVDQSIARMRATLNAVVNPIESAAAMINYGASLPGVIMAAVCSTVERLAIAAEGIGNAPVMFVSSMRSNIARLRAAVPALGSQIMIAGANIAALVTGRIFANDESQKAVLRRIEDTPVWRPDGTSLNMPPAPKVLTANELDESLARIHEMIQDGINASRAIGCAPAVHILCAQADALTRYINAVKLERDRIVSVEVEDAMPLHLICLRHGLPYSYADRIATINNFWNPTFAAGQVRIYERRHG